MPSLQPKRARRRSNNTFARAPASRYRTRMKIATWNVNSLRVRLPQVLPWLERQAPDVLCMQETKILDEDFPVEDFRARGYHPVYCGQKSYNGMAILSRTPADEVTVGLPSFDDPQKRLLAARCHDVRVINVYVPNGQAVGSDKYAYKLAWLAHLRDYVQAQLAIHPRVILTGDFNIAPEDRDVHDPRVWVGQVMVSEDERRAFRDLTALGLTDAFRRFEQAEASFSWWDYRAGAFRRNLGLRIDHVLCSPALHERCRACYIDKEPRRLERPSDHAPVIAEFEMP
jgi:exodeoxyribonuclease-3